VEKKFQTRLSYPDPFKPVGIEFELPEDATVTIQIFDNNGTAKLSLLEQTNMKTGVHMLECKIQDFDDGKHFYRINAISEKHEYNETRRI